MGLATPCVVSQYFTVPQAHAKRARGAPESFSHQGLVANAGWQHCVLTDATLQAVGDPIANVVDAHLPVIRLSMVVPAVFRRQYFEVFVG